MKKLILAFLIAVSSIYGLDLRLPFDGSYVCTQGPKGTTSHIKSEYTKYDLDFALSKGTEVLAAGDGKVIAASYKGKWGNRILIRHSDGNVTIYAHLSKFLVEEGENVTKGQVIAESGNTGFSTNPHLHFGLHSGKTRKSIPGLRVFAEEIVGDKVSHKFFQITEKKSDFRCGNGTYYKHALNSKTYHLEVLYLRRLGTIAWYPQDKTCINAERWYRITRKSEIIDKNSPYAWKYTEDSVDVCYLPINEIFPNPFTTSIREIENNEFMQSTLFGETSDGMCIYTITP